MVQKKELENVVASFKDQVLKSKENQENNLSEENINIKIAKFIKLLTKEQRQNILKLMREKVGNKIIIEDESNDLNFESEFSCSLRFLSEKDKIEFLQMIKKQIMINNKENGIQISPNMSKKEFIIELSKLLLAKTLDDKENSIFSRLIIEELMTCNLPNVQVQEDKFLNSRLFGIEAFHHAVQGAYVTRAKFDNFGDFLSMIVSNPEEFYAEYNLTDILIGDEMFNLSSEESIMLYENVLLPYYEFLGLTTNVSRNYNLNDLSFVKYALEYDDEFDTMEFTSQELSFVSKILNKETKQNKHNR